MSRTSKKIWMLAVLSLPMAWVACGDGGGEGVGGEGTGGGDGVIAEPDATGEGQQVGRGRGGFTTLSGEDGSGGGAGTAPVSGGNSGVTEGKAGAGGSATGGSGGMVVTGTGGAAGSQAPLGGAGGSNPADEKPLIAKVIKTKLLIADIIYTKQIKLGVARISEMSQSREENRYELTNGAPDIDQPTVRAGVVYAEDIEADEKPLVAKVIKTKLLIADIIYTKQIKLGVARIGEMSESKEEIRYELTNGAPDVNQPTVRAGVVYAEDIEADEVQARQLFAQKIQYF